MTGADTTSHRRGRAVLAVGLTGAAALSGLVLTPVGGGSASASPNGGGSKSGGSTNPAITLSSPGIGTWGNPGSATTLVLYDTTGSYGYLGSLYAMAAGNLATHFGRVTAEPVASYQAGQMAGYTATIYLGSTYNEPIPASFIADAQNTSRPVIWAGDNIWEVTGSAGSSSDTAFENKYGWDPSTSYFTSTSAFNRVQYKGQSLTRFDTQGLANALIDPTITNPSAVSVLATAVADPSVSSGYSTVPWAIRSSNLTYIGEIPFSYVNETDRVMAFSDMLFDALAPQTAQTRRALVRLEDLNATDDPNQLVAMGQYLHNAGVPFSFNVIPQYEDPNGYYNGGVAQSISLKQAPQFVSAIKQLESLGGTLVDEGYTHQYSNIDNPYSAVSGDDFEFYRAQCSTTSTAPYQFEDPCAVSDYVIEEGPVPSDSASWASGRFSNARQEFHAAGLGYPQFFVFPHYAASVVDYQSAQSQYPYFYDRRVYPGALLAGGTPNYGSGHVLGQFFPYTVTDAYGETVVPENLGNYQPTPENNSPVRTVSDLVNEAQLNTVVRDGTASFFYDPTLGLDPLTQIVQGIQSAGYTFVSPQTLLASP